MVIVSVSWTAPFLEVLFIQIIPWFCIEARWMAWISCSPTHRAAHKGNFLHIKDVKKHSHSRTQPPTRYRYISIDLYLLHGKWKGKEKQCCELKKIQGGGTYGRRTSYVWKNNFFDVCRRDFLFLYSKCTCTNFTVFFFLNTALGFIAIAICTLEAIHSTFCFPNGSLLKSQLQPVVLLSSVSLA